MSASMSSSLCAAESAMRTRLVPRGTVGGRIAGAWSPTRNKPAAALNAADSRAPYSTQKIGLTIASRRERPRAEEPCSVVVSQASRSVWFLRLCLGWFLRFRFRPRHNTAEVRLKTPRLATRRSRAARDAKPFRAGRAPRPRWRLRRRRRRRRPRRAATRTPRRDARRGKRRGEHGGSRRGE